MPRFRTVYSTIKHRSSAEVRVAHVTGNRFRRRTCRKGKKIPPEARAAIRQASDIFYASHNWQAFFLQGTKTLAYELWEDLGFKAPDNILIPTGAGSNILGCDIGFDELYRRGEIERLPRLFAVQPSNCAPIHASFITGGRRLRPG